jgi:uncharacterized SAM-binding protein YcdF (DUF218 family)
VGGASALVFFVFAYTPASRWLHEGMLTPSNPQPADAVVVLGAAVSSDGLLDDVSLRRAIAGVRAQKRGLAPLLLFLGARHGQAVEAEVRAELARDLGVPPAEIFTESRALTTQQEAQRAAERLLPTGARHVLLVTGEYHIWRARRLFERAGFAVSPLAVREASAATDRPDQRLELARGALTEALARALYRVLGRV